MSICRPPSGSDHALEHSQLSSGHSHLITLMVGGTEEHAQQLCRPHRLDDCHCGQGRAAISDATGKGSMRPLPLGVSGYAVVAGILQKSRQLHMFKLLPCRLLFDRPALQTQCLLLRAAGGYGWPAAWDDSAAATWWPCRAQLTDWSRPTLSGFCRCKLVV